MKELVFNIDTKVKDEKTVIVDIFEGEREGVRVNPLPSSLLTLNKILELKKRDEEDLIDFLIEEETAYLRSISPREKLTFLGKVHIPFSKSFKAFKLLAATGKFFLDKKPAFIDLFSKNPLTFQLEEQESGNFLVTATLKIGEKVLKLRELEMISQGNPPWCTVGASVKMISSDLSWKWIQKSASLSLLSKKELGLLIEELEASDEKFTLIELKNKSSTKTVNPSPYPILKLQDPQGISANLLMDYQHRIVSLHSPDIKDRKLDEERGWEKDLLESGYIKKIVGSSHYYCPQDLVKKALSFLLEIGWHILDLQGREVLLLSDTALEIREEAEEIILKGSLTFGKESYDLIAIKDSIHSRSFSCPLSQKSVGLLPDHFLQGPLLDLLSEGEKKGESLTLKLEQFGEIASLQESLSTLVIDPNLQTLIQTLKETSKAPLSPPSSEFKGNLRPYQQEGVNWLQFLFDAKLSALLADDMGLGKTVQVLAFLSRLTVTLPVLIVCPTTLLFHWERQREEFLPSFPCILHHGLKREKKIREERSLIVTTYTTLRQDFDLFKETHFSIIILDEAQAIKNVETKTTQAILKLQSDFRISISGTPVENHLGELKSQFDFLLPSLFHNDDLSLARVKQKTRPFILRRTKSQVAKDLPEKIEQTLWIEMTDCQKEIYTEAARSIKENISQRKASPMAIFEAILRLRQLACHPLLVKSDYPSLESPKLLQLLQDVDILLEEGQKVIIFSQFTSMLNLISTALHEKNLKTLRLDGSTKNREEVVRQFQEDSSFPLFLISLKAGGVGLNLTQADTVILYEPWWNEAAENQAIDRAHRIGRKGTVLAKRYILLGSIEEKIMELKKEKRKLFDDLFDDTFSSSKLTEDDFYFLLS